MATVKAPQIDLQKWIVLLAVLTCLDLLDTFHTYIGVLGQGRHGSLLSVVYSCERYWLPYFIFTPVIMRLLDGFPLNTRQLRNVFVHGGAALAFAYIHNIVLAFGDYSSGKTYILRLSALVKFDFASDFLVYWVIVGTASMLAYFAELKRREVAEVELKANLIQANLETLQAQLNPHFFFNTLQAVSTLALAGERDAVVRTLGCLSDMIRISFDKRRPPKVSLESELEFVDRYLSLQQMLIGDRLNVHKYIEPDALRALVPTMVLQPLIENAIVHGIASQPGAGTITVLAVRCNDSLRLEVSDNGSGFRSNATRGNGIGLAGAKARLELLYGPSQSIEFGHSREGGALVAFSVPFEYCVSGRAGQVCT